MTKDFLTRSHTIWCAWCSDWETFEQRTEAGTIEAAKKRGWTIKGKSAFCHECDKRGGAPDWAKQIKD